MRMHFLFFKFRGTRKHTSGLKCNDPLRRQRCGLRAQLPALLDHTAPQPRPPFRHVHQNRAAVDPWVTQQQNPLIFLHGLANGCEEKKLIFFSLRKFGEGVANWGRDKYRGKYAYHICSSKRSCYFAGPEPLRATGGSRDGKIPPHLSCGKA